MVNNRSFNLIKYRSGSFDWYRLGNFPIIINFLTNISPRGVLFTKKENRNLRFLLVVDLLEPFLNHRSWSPETVIKIERCVFNTKDNTQDKIKLRIFLKYWIHISMELAWCQYTVRWTFSHVCVFITNLVMVRSDFQIQ